jgi:hypothetical protein
MKKVMMNKIFLLNTKIKYILGAEKDLPSYPTKEDLFYLIAFWWYHENGKEKILKYKFMEDIDLEENQIIFTKSVLYNSIDINLHKKVDDFFTEQDIFNNLKIFRETKKEIFYEYRHIIKDDIK